MNRRQDGDPDVGDARKERALNAAIAAYNKEIAALEKATLRAKAAIDHAWRVSEKAAYRRYMEAVNAINPEKKDS